MTEQEIQRALFDYDKNYNLRMEFKDSLYNLFDSLIREYNIDIHSISCRIKEKDSFKTKCEKEKYNNFLQITDIVGLRIITYFTDDVEKICNLIESEFFVDQQNSIDKHSQLSENEFGYLSVHKIIKLSNDRLLLTENKRYKDCVAEVQVRTLLQHAWAEIEHDRRYKSGIVLPPDIARRFYMSAGVLELIDLEFQRISNEISEYSNQIISMAEKGKMDITIDSISLFEYMSKKFDFTNVKKTFNMGDGEIIEELENFGIVTIKGLDDIISQACINYVKTKTRAYNLIGICRSIMIINDTQKYFEKSWNNHWSVVNSESLELWKSFNVDMSVVLQYLDNDLK